jgi:hypothetical protein
MERKDFDKHLTWRCVDDKCKMKNDGNFMKDKMRHSPIHTRGSLVIPTGEVGNLWLSP